MSTDLLTASALALWILVAVLWATTREGNHAPYRAGTTMMRGLLAAVGMAYIVMACKATVMVFGAVLRAWPR